MAAEIDVPAHEFFEAASRSGRVRRGPSGTRAEIAKDTQIRPVMGGIVVDTPMIGTEISASGEWDREVSLDSIKLVNVCKQILKLGAKKDPDAILTLGAASGQFWIRYKTTKIAIPAIWIKEFYDGK